MQQAHTPPRIIYPANRREARLWNYFGKGDHFWQIRDWPKWLQALALKAHKLNRDRYQLFYFFVSNGLDPSMASRWVLLYDFVNGTEIFGDYDKHAMDQVMKQLPNQLEAGTLFTGKKLAIDMTKKRVVLM